VGPVIAHDQVDDQRVWDRGVNRVNELPKIQPNVATMKLRDELRGLRVQHHEERRPVPLVVMRAAQLGPVASAAAAASGRPLESVIFVDSEHDRVVRRIHVQPDDVTHLLDQQRIGRQLKRLAPMRL
jgi:hypothetical protein